MKGVSYKIVIIFLVFFMSSATRNITFADHTNHTHVKPKHRLTNVWAAQSVVGMFGLLLNGILLILFISVKETFTTSINLMIW